MWVGVGVRVVDRVDVEGSQPPWCHMGLSVITSVERRLADQQWTVVTEREAGSHIKVSQGHGNLTN